MKIQWRDESGQTVVVTAFAMLVIMAFLGLAIDVGHLRFAHRNLQTAADAAALAAGLELRTCSTVANCPAMQAAAKNALVENGFTGASFIANCASAAGTSLTLMLNDPPCELGTRDPDNNNSRYVEAVVSKQERTYFARLLGYDHITLKARAEAVRYPGPNCIYALDPTGSGAISVLVGVAITAQCGIVDESSSATALTCVVGAFITAPRVAITGTTGSLLCGLSSTPRKNVARPVPNDPLAYLPKPTVGACGTSTASPYTGAPKQVSLTLGGTYVFNPGVYCGGISYTAALASTVTFNPGTYILKPGLNALGATVGGLTITITALSTINAAGVTFYNVGPQGAIAITSPAALSLSKIIFSAPTSGTYGGVLYWQASTNTTAGTVVANLVQGSKLEGAIYMPAATLNYGVGAASSNYTIVVAKDLTFNAAVASSFGNNYSSLQIGSPLNGDAAALLE